MGTTKIKVGSQYIPIPRGPKGEKGDVGAVGPTGPANTLTIGTVSSGAEADASITTTQAEDLGLLLGWNFDEASGVQTVEDLSGNGRTLDLGSYATSGRTTGKSGGGITGYVNGAINFSRSSTGLETASRTLMLWAKVRTSVSGYRHAVWLQNAGGSTVWGIGVQTGADESKAWFRARSSGGSVFDATPTQPAVDTWAHYALTFDANTGQVTAYLDGVQVGQTSAGWASAIEASTGSLFTFYTTGFDIDDVRVYDRHMSEADVQLRMGTPVGTSLGGVEPTSQTLNLTLPKGDTGPANTLAIGTVSTSAPGGAASATITGTAPNQTLNLTIPRGETGPQGPSGAPPTGSFYAFAGTTIPAGHLLCNGQAVSRTTYAALFGEIGTTYGAGDGSTTFNVPDMRVRVPIGAGTGRAMGASDGVAEASRSGSWSHSHSHSGGSSTTGISGSFSDTSSSSGSHNHGGTTGSFSHTQLVNTTATGNTQRLIGPVTHDHSISGDGSHTHSISGSVSLSDSGHSHSVGSGGSATHPYLVANYIIKT